MSHLPKEHWIVAFANDSNESKWNKSLSKLTVGYRWIVNSAIRYMTITQYPWKLYPGSICTECSDDLHLLDISHSRIGPNKIQIVIYFDRKNHRMYPIHCEVVDD